MVRRGGLSSLQYPLGTRTTGFFPQGFFIKVFPKHPSYMGVSITLGGIRISVLSIIEVLMVFFCAQSVLVVSRFLISLLSPTHTHNRSIVACSHELLALWFCSCGYFLVLFTQSWRHACMACRLRIWSFWCLEGTPSTLFCKRYGPQGPLRVSLPHFQLLLFLVISVLLAPQIGGLHHLIHKTNQGVHKGNDYERYLE